MSLGRKGIVLGIVLATCVATSVSVAQQVERMSRPFASHMGADGRLAVLPDATLGNLVVDQYIGIGAKFAAAADNRDAMVRAYSGSMCADSGIGKIVANSAAAVVESMHKEERDNLKARDPASLTTLSIAVLANLDAVSAEAIRADEAIGPGVYHDGIEALDAAWGACGFFGLAAKL